jgi:hypothetical protein
MYSVGSKEIRSRNEYHCISAASERSTNLEIVTPRIKSWLRINVNSTGGELESADKVPASLAEQEGE